jgi:hypothetical protein
MSDAATRWGLYPWFPEDGADKVHPQDLDALRSLGPYCRVFEVAAGESPYVVLIYGIQRFRVVPDLVQEVEPPQLRIGDEVLLSSGAHATVRDIRWHHKRAEPFFLVDVGGRTTSKRYWANDLVRV